MNSFPPFDRVRRNRGGRVKAFASPAMQSRSSHRLNMRSNLAYEKLVRVVLDAESPWLFALPPTF